MLRDTSKKPPLVIAARHTILRENGDLWSTFAAVHSLIFFSQLKKCEADEGRVVPSSPPPFSFLLGFAPHTNQALLVFSVRG